MKYSYFNLILFVFGLLNCWASNVKAWEIRISYPEEEQEVSDVVTINANILPNTCIKNPGFNELNNLFEKLHKDYSPELIKAIAWQESRWTQYSSNEECYISNNYTMEGGKEKIDSYDFGIMQINNENSPLKLKEIHIEKGKNDIAQNILYGLASLDEKKNYIQKLKKNGKWPGIERKCDLTGHSEQDILLKAYNGFIRSWKYPDSINKIIESKPWESETSISLFVNKNLEKALKVRLIDVFSHPWDSKKCEDGNQILKVQAMKEKIQKSHEITVKTKNKFTGSGTITGVIQNEEIQNQFSIEFSDIKLKPFVAPTPTADQQKIIDMQKQSLERLKNMNIDNLNAVGQINKYSELVEQLVEQQKKSVRGRELPRCVGYIFEAKGKIAVTINQKKIVRGEMKFKNPYRLQCKFKGFISDRNTVEEDNVRAMRLFNENRVLPTFLEYDFQGKGNLLLSLGPEENKEFRDKFIKYDQRDMVSGNIISNDNVNSIPVTPYLRNESHVAFLAWEDLFGGILLEMDVDENGKKMVVLADSTNTSYGLDEKKNIVVDETNHCRANGTLTIGENAEK